MDKFRYDRQLLLKEIGESGQQKLLDAHIVIVGCGGLGSIAAPYLAGAGVGSICLIDGDIPDISNVHRQVMFTGQEQSTKAEVLAEHIARLNPDVRLKVIPHMLTKHNIEECLSAADVVLECSDSVLCKYLINDYCHLENIPLVYGAIHKYEGYVSFFENVDESSIHLRDVFPLPDLDIPSCSDIGVLNIIAGVIGLFQANEVIKYLTEIATPLKGILLSYNCLTSEQLKLKLSKNWNGDIEEIYDGLEYTAIDCGLTPEKTISEIHTELGSYRIISILAVAEYISIAAHTERYEADEVKAVLTGSVGKKTLIYCRTGRKSAMLITQLLKDHPDLEVYNLKGGLMAYQQFKALS